MAITLHKIRPSLKTALCIGRSGSSAIIKRSFSSSSNHDAFYEAKEADRWEKITYLGIASCAGLGCWNLSKGHPHFDEPPPYLYLHIRNKEFPWDSDGLFEVKEHH